MDTNSFVHTVFSVSAHETSKEFIRILKAHCQQWGTPVGLVYDNGSVNPSDTSNTFQKLQNQINRKNVSSEDQAKLDFICCLIKDIGIYPDKKVITRAEKTLTFFNKWRELLRFLIKNKKPFT